MSKIRKFTAKQWFVIVIMELIILIAVGFLVAQFILGLKQAKSEGTSIHPLAIFCLVMAIVLFVGLNILMIFFIKRASKK